MSGIEDRDKAEMFRCDLVREVQAVNRFCISARAAYKVSPDNVLTRWTLSDWDCMKIQINRNNPVLQGIFTDSSGFHAIVTFADQDAHYVHLSAESSVFLHKMHDFNIQSVGWNRESAEFHTKECIVGTDRGLIIELIIEFDYSKADLKDHWVTRLIDIPGSPCIYGIGFSIIPGIPPKTLVIVATPYSLYQFSGNSHDLKSPEFPKVFERYRQNPSIITSSGHEVRGLNTTSQLQFFYKNNGRAHSFAWLSGAALMYGKIPKSSHDNIYISQMNPVAYPEGIGPSLVGVGITGYYVYFLYKNCFYIVSKLNQQVVQKINFKENNIIGITYSNYRFFVWSSRSVYQITVKNEANEVWKYFIEQNKYQKAFKFCMKYNSPDLPKIRGIYGDHLFENSELIKAAQEYSESDRLFEDVCLILLENNVALREYLEIRLGTLHRNERSQRTLLCAWLLEIQLTEINKALIENNATLFRQIQKDLRAFLRSNSDFLDEQTTYTQLQTHGRIDEWVYFAKLKRNYDYIMNHYINTHDYKSALRKLEGADIIDKMNIGYRYSHILIRHEPTKTIELLIEAGEYCRDNNIAFDIERILIILGNIDNEYLDEAIKLERFCIEELRISHKELHLLYIFHLSQRDEVTLTKYLKMQGRHSESEAILSILKNNNQIEGQIAFLSTIGEKYQSIALALQHNRQEEAKNIAKSANLYNKELAKEL